MAVRFTCRLVTTPAEGGKFRVGYGLITPGVRVVTVTGPEVVLPPAGEMTEAEMYRWQFDAGNRPGFRATSTYHVGPPPAALVEAAVAVEGSVPRGAVGWRLLWAENEKGERTVAVDLLNTWNQPVPAVSLATAWEAQTPQPIGPGADGVEGMVGAVAAGEEAAFHQPDPVACDDLHPDRPARFVYDPRLMPALRSRAAALSPEHHRISIRTGGQEFDHIPGSAVAAFLESDQA